MKFAPTLAVVSLVLSNAVAAFGASPDAGGAPSVGAAQKMLEAARTKLTEAVARIQKDPPANEDLESAHVAVGALKDAIDAGAAYEATDLDYARAVLTARKELRTQREYVDQRRANVHIHEHRRVIDGALTKLSDSARATEGKDASPKDFDDARAAAEALKKAVDEARVFAKQDPKFASYLTEVDATLARQLKAIDDRSTHLSVDKYRALVEESRRALTASMTELGKGASDAAFEGAERAAVLVTKRLEEGKELEAKDKTYRADAGRARTELAQARKRIDALWSETGLARLKAEIEPAHKDLTAAGKALRAKTPTPDQLAEARTAAIVVRKLLEKFQAEASRSQAFGQYVAEVKRTLVEVEVELERRSLSSAQTDLLQALKRVEGKDATDENFEEAKTAVVVVEKTLEAVHVKEPALAKPVADARWLLTTARTTLAKRRVEVDVQRQRAKVEEARKAAAALIGQPNPGKEQLQEADKALAQLRAVLEEGAALSKTDSDYAVYSRDAKARITELGDRLAARKVTLAASDGRTLLTELLTAAKTKLDTARQPESTDAEIEAASKGVDAVRQAIEAHTALEKQDKGYATQAERARAELDRLTGVLDLAKQVRVLRRETVEAFAAGAAAADSAAASRELRPQKEQYAKALAHFKSCEADGASRLKENPALVTAAVMVEGKPGTPKDVMALCSQRAQATQELFKQVVPLLQFEEGVKRFFEAGKGLLAQNKKTEALTQFDECIASGVILQTRNPELKERQFEVGGSSMTLGELTRLCVTHTKTLRGK